MVSRHPQLSPCAAPEPDPALGSSSDSLQGPPAVSHIVYLTGKGSFVHYCCQSFTPLHLCVQSFLPMCKTLCHLPCIALSFSFSRIFPQIPHPLWILMQVSNSSPAVHADNLMSSTLFNKHGNPHRTSALLVHMMDGIYSMINHTMYCFPFLCSCGPYLLSPA